MAAPIAAKAAPQRTATRCCTMCHANDASASRSNGGPIAAIPASIALRRKAPRKSRSRQRLLFESALDVAPQPHARPLMHAGPLRAIVRHRIGGEETEDRPDNAEDAIKDHDRADADVQVTRLHVVSARGRQSEREDEDRDAECRCATERRADYRADDATPRSCESQRRSTATRERPRRAPPASSTAGQNGEERVPPEVNAMAALVAAHLRASRYTNRAAPG